jgi:hypothetical protein
MRLEIEDVFVLDYVTNIWFCGGKFTIKLYGTNININTSYKNYTDIVRTIVFNQLRTKTYATITKELSSIIEACTTNRHNVTYYCSIVLYDFITVMTTISNELHFKYN